MWETIRENPTGAFILFLCTIWAVERMFTAYVNRNKPECDCERDCECECDEDEEEDAEVIAMGGQVEDDSPAEEEKKV
jgi:hypothetical protein